MAKLKRSLFIGLGGTGLKSILHTKKRFIDTYGEIPPMTGFIALDTDINSRNIELDSNLGDQRINLDASEFQYISVHNPQDVLLVTPDLFSFVPQKNRDSLISLTHGAGQVRSSGRFATHFNYDAIENAIKTKLTSILRADGIHHPKFSVNGNDIEINMMFSVAGGTGSGTFIDIAYIVKEVSKSISASIGVSTIGFAILPDVFNAMMTGPAMANVLPNGYGALYDLDYLMHHSYYKKPLYIKYDNKTIEIKEPPFSLMFTINNSDKYGKTITEIDDLSELIGLAMFTGASELSGPMMSSYDNVRTVIAGGTMNVGNKKSWACGLGLSELYYDGNKLGNIYAHKASISIINNLIAAETDSFDLDDIFIDNAKIRENNGDENNDLIDSLLSESPNVPYSHISDEKAIEAEIKVYLDNVSKTAEENIDENFIAKENKVNQQLKQFIIEHVNKPSGVGNVDRFLNGLTKHVNVFLKEMIQEEKERTVLEGIFKNQLSQNISEFNNLSFIERKLGSRYKSTKDDIIQSVNLIANNIHELLRRKYAITYFNNLLLTIDEEYSKITDIKFKLKNIYEDCESKFIGLQNQINEEPKLFVKELHRSFLNKVTVSNKDISVSDFIKSISNKNKLYDFSEMTPILISDHFWSFSKELPKALAYRNKKIDDVLRDYEKDDAGVLDKIINELIIKSNPLWSYNYKGHVVNKQHHEAFIVGVPNANNSVLVQNDSFEKQLEANQKAQFISTNMHDRVVVYRMEAAVPIYSVSNMGLYEEKSKVSNICHHIDANWLSRMANEGFGIYPSKQEDHSLEYWVFGIIYDLIKYENNSYLAYSKTHGKPTKGFWYSLGNYRDEAFNEFKRLKLQDEFKEAIKKKIKELGDTENNKLIKEVASGENYLNKYSKRNFELEELEDTKMKNIEDLYNKEIIFVTSLLDT